MRIEKYAQRIERKLAKCNRLQDVDERVKLGEEIYVDIQRLNELLKAEIAARVAIRDWLQLILRKLLRDVFDATQEEVR